MKKVFFYSLFAAFLLLAVSCSDSTVTDPEDIIFPDSNISYQKHVEPFMRLTCAYQGCHNNTTQAAGIILDDWFYMTNAMSGAFIIPSKPDNSVLVQMLEGKYPHLYEHIWRPRINDEQIEGIRQWILEGAELN